MTEPAPDVWQPLARALADEVTPDGSLWHDIVATTPRHEFVPVFLDTSHSPPRRITVDDPNWLERIYADRPLTIQRQEHPDHPGLHIPTSSTTAPSLMVAMLNELEVDDTSRVLELGTGTGYNASLLCARLGDAAVVSVDLDPALVDAARVRLARLGSHPVLATADSRSGCPSGAPYDRVIATHAVERVPYAWVAQTRPGGRIVCDVRSAASADLGRLATLTVNGDGTASGRFWPTDPGGFMAARTRVDVPPGFFGLSSRDLRDAQRRPNQISPTALTSQDFRFALWTRAPHVAVHPGAETVTSTRDASWATVSGADVDVAGPVDLWQVVENSYTWWMDSGKPTVTDFGITVTPDGQQVWLGDGRKHERDDK